MTNQINPKADLRAVDSPKKQTNEFVFFFAVKSKKAKKKLFFCILGRIYCAPICLGLYLTFRFCLHITTTPLPLPQPPGFSELLRAL